MPISTNDIRAIVIRTNANVTITFKTMVRIKTTKTKAIKAGVIKTNVIRTNVVRPKVSASLRRKGNSCFYCCYIFVSNSGQCYKTYLGVMLSPLP
jgi:hypothetical protein